MIFDLYVAEERNTRPTLFSEGWLLRYIFNSGNMKFNQLGKFLSTVLASFNVNLTQVRVIWEEGTSNGKYLYHIGM